MADCSSLYYIINHVFLPTKLPQDDDNDATKSTILTEKLLAALNLFQNYAEERKRLEWTPCIDMITSMLRSRDQSGGLLAEEIDSRLESLKDKDVLALFIRGQNAGLIVRRSLDQYSFESFEVSPTNEAVIGAKGRLRRCFPGPAATISKDRIANASFREALAELLMHLDAETLEEVSPTVKKARSSVVEIRDTVSPRMVTEMLTAILSAIGQPLDVPHVYKRTREDVLWKNAFRPWHRSSLWLFLRVAMQTSLLRYDLADDLHVRYKSFMMFFMAYILRDALEASYPSDVLFMMMAKISRRALKLGRVDQAAWLLYTQKTVAAVQQELTLRWSKIVMNPDSPEIWQNQEPSKLPFLFDTKLTLSSLQPYLIKRTNRVGVISNDRGFTPACLPRITTTSSISPKLDLSKEHKEDDKRLLLADLELWVEDCLDDWISTNKDLENTCTALASIISGYLSAASSTYEDKPEEVSLMLLVTMELWVALDKCAVHHCSLLADYCPGFPLSLFEPLLLPKKHQLYRLFRIEKYLIVRKKAAKLRLPSIFQNSNTKMDFAVRYFEQSSQHNDLRHKIEAEAADKRARKLSELTEKHRQYNQLIQQSSAMSCEYVFKQKKRQAAVPKHSKSCQKCEIKSRAQALTIDVHEHPLPKGDLEAKSAVFELAVPEFISKWRDTTYSILIDIFTPRTWKNGHPKTHTLHGYAGLIEHIKFKAGRLQLASIAKPFIVSHYRNKPVVQADENNICVNNGMHYLMYDTKAKLLTIELLEQCNVREKCTFKLPLGAYQKLQYAVAHTTHTSNEVMASQAECPETLTRHEYYAFATLRSGHRLQWRNIARELIANVLNFSREETYNLIIQAIWQAGPLDERKICRESHVDLEEKEFGSSLLLILNDSLTNIEGNWQGAVAARTFISLVTRLLSFTSCDFVRKSCFQILRRAREVTLQWTRDLNQKLQDGQKDGNCKFWAVRTLEMALTCHGTFDVDRHFLAKVLNSEEEIAIIIECSIIVHDRCSIRTSRLPLSVKALLRRYWRLSHLLEPVLRKKRLLLQSSLDRTISRLWVGYKPGSSWSALDVPNERWLSTSTSRESGFSSMPVHFNILDGSLLVNGLPLARLPQSYEAHSNYGRLFGEKALDIIPSRLDGMAFETRNELSGHQIYFRMHESELIIRTKKHNLIYELLPIHAVQHDFPQALVQGYAHWLDIETGVVEWRPIASPWTSSSQNWHMKPSSQGGYVLTRDKAKLIDIHSSTAKFVLSVLAPIEHAIHIQITFDEETEVLDVHLPRLKLDFCLRRYSPHLESKQFRGMFVDENQAFGTLIGLENKLVLRGCNNLSRSVIIPHGDIIFRPDGHHVRVQINLNSSHNVSYHLYQIDHQLGRLIDNGSLKSRLFKCYLHAITAHCLKDDLTGRTGTEEALWCLAAASTGSFLRLEQAEIDLLKILAQLTPRRQYYPRHLQVMQEVQWETLSPISQHSSFYKLVKSILRKAEDFHLFWDKPIELSDAIDFADEHLLGRAAIRDSIYRVHCFGAEDHTTEHDVVYISRDQVSQSTRENETSCTARLVDNWSSELKGCSRLLHEIESWGKPLHFPQTGSSVSFGYSRKWLNSPATFLPNDLCALLKALSQSTMKQDKYRIMFMLSTIAYSRNAGLELVQTFLAFATNPKLRALQLPKHPLFKLSQGYAPVRKELISMVERRTRSYRACPESRLPQLPDETSADADERRKEEHQAAREERVKKFVDSLICQWPKEKIRAPTDTDCNTYILMEEAVKDAQERFCIWNANLEFQEFIKEAQNVLDNLTPRNEERKPCSFVLPLENYSPKRTYISFDDITDVPAPTIPPPNPTSLDSWIVKKSRGQVDPSKFESMLKPVSSKHLGGYEQRYINDLRASFNSLHEDAIFQLKNSLETLQLLLKEHLKQCNDYVDELYHTIYYNLGTETSTIYQLVYVVGLGPRLSPTSLLSQLAWSRIAGLHSDWKRLLVEYGMAISTSQHAKRLFACSGNVEDLLSELRNTGHDGWDPMQYPDWLLLEIENNMLIRPVQAQIALEMISPSSGANSIMQLNMGEGKSSVIVPIVAAALADGKRLVRVVVLKQLSAQMFHLLVQKLGGMLNRRIFYMPFSRSLRLEVHQATKIRYLYEECMHGGGILLVQPEHLLSFQLIGPERLLSGKSELGNVLIRTQQWLEQNSRDILDESDEILSVRFELIYAIGTQRAVEFSPSRWVVVQHVLGLVDRFAEQVLDIFPGGLTFQRVCPGSFPRIRILEPVAGKKLLNMVAREICDTGLPGVPVWILRQSIRNLLFQFLTASNLNDADTEALQRHFFGIDSVRSSTLLLLKGLIVGGILTFAFEHKRWRVNYGLDLSRTMLAVPYRAKDSPATRAEFSHPDVTIVLTCLSYYLGSLSDEQLYANFERLSLSDNAREEYERWVQDAPNLPLKFRQLIGVNLSDSIQCSRHIFPSLRSAKNVIDFYLSHVVFPKEMKEFPHKLSTSGWDIARSKAYPTTGFSGTNDSRYILPLSIDQCDMNQQSHTNATQLNCLLRAENSFINFTEVSAREVLDAESLLHLVVNVKYDPPIRVILDVGAQVLEMQNKEVAYTWLTRTPESEAQAAIFFDNRNELTVLSRDGIMEPLMVSHFATQMDQCLIYLDEAHTRGTDLQLPTNYRAIVTLGPDLTKDRLVQACMRMRKLGKGQSVLFCGPREVEQKILKCSGKASSAPIEVEDVLKWSISETHLHTRRSIPLWVTQGIRQQRHFMVWSGSANGENEESSLAIAETLLETEAQSLQERYGTSKQLEDQFLLQLVRDESLVRRRKQVCAIRDKCRTFEVPLFTSRSLQEEQERELSPENEREQQIEGPPSLKPQKHNVHPHVKLFIQLGKLNRLSNAFQPAFKTLSDTSAFKHLEMKAWRDVLLVTTDFARTIHAEKQLRDSFLRPVHWIASSMDGECVILSPYEANELLPLIRQHQVARLHMYSPRTNISAPSLEELSFCAVPAVPLSWSIPPVVRQVNLFAGQLYLQGYDDYLSLCQYLGLCYHPPSDHVQVSNDGFVSPVDRARFDVDMAKECPFTISPVEFLRVLITLRRKGQSFRMSHLGRILNGELIGREQFVRDI